MKAAQYNSYGGPEVIEVNPNAPTPTLKKQQIMVEVHAAAVNPFDFKIRRGYMKEDVPLTFPITIGGDFSGVVTEVADGVSEFAVGDEVFGQAIVLSGGSGSLAEFAAANTKNTAKRPQTISHAQAASLVLVGASAVQAVEEHLHLQSGQKILIHGGAGGIGSLAIQLAKHIGAYIATTVSEKDIEFVKSLGADEVIDYHAQKFEEIIKDFDAVFDTIGGDTLEKSVGVLKQGGILVSMEGKPDEQKVQQAGIVAIGQGTQTNTTHLTRVKELVETDVLKPQVAKTFTLDEASQAYDYLENSHPKGKVVVTIR